jgi:hypothetical protein
MGRSPWVLESSRVGAGAVVCPSLSPPIHAESPYLLGLHMYTAGFGMVREALQNVASFLASDLQTKAYVGAVVGLPLLYGVSWVNTEM